MGKIKEIAEIRAVTSFEDLRRFVSLQFKQILEIVNGNLNFTDNLRSVILNVTFPAANQDVKILHGLGVVPKGYIVIDSRTALTVTRTQNSTDSEIVLSSTAAASDVKLLIF